MCITRLASVPELPLRRHASLQNLKENVDAGKINLSPEDVQAVREIADKANASQGDRYPEAYMKALYADTPLP